ncbi:hypothetical protein KFE25_002804 [Diacronema lutheri]|uniref:Ion transport domain-containing protein n=1 Tax=Diacronema lutheri TaxID=2081491 RepID=A0A8J5XP01_DIALT|nr:hypothetical protein KFE25_002804 [Diacronema lutheri]
MRGCAPSALDAEPAPPSAARRAVVRIVSHASFDRAILALILADAGAYALVGPVRAEPAWMSRLSLASQLVFTSELLLRAYAHSPCRFVRDRWNALDGAIVGALWLPYALPSSGEWTWVRCVRALRLLRSVRRLPALRALVETMARASGGLRDVLALLTLLLGFFAILGVQLFQGTMRGRCLLRPLADGGADFDEDEDAVVCWPPRHARRACAPDRVCVDVGRNPHSGAVGFDHFGQALLTCFQVITLEGWTELMHAEMGALGTPSAAFFVALVVLGSLLALNLLLVVMYERFEPARAPADGGDATVAARAARAGELGEGRAELDAEAAVPNSRASAKSASAAADPEVPAVHLEVPAAVLERPAADSTLPAAEARWSRPQPEEGTPHGALSPPADWRDEQWERVSTAVTLANTLALCCYYAGMPIRLERALEALNVCFVAFFATELALTLRRVGVGALVSDPLSALDGVVVLLALLELINALGVGAGAMDVSALRAMRLLRVARLARTLPRVRHVIAIMAHSMLDLGALLALLVLLLAVYALLGMQLFGGRFASADANPAVAESAWRAPLGVAVGGRPRAHFDDFARAMLSAMIVLSGEGWNELMYAAFPISRVEAIGYFCSLVVLGNFILVNLVVTILIANVARTSADERGVDGAAAKSDAQADARARGAARAGALERARASTVEALSGLAATAPSPDSAGAAGGHAPTEPTRSASRVMLLPTDAPRSGDDDDGARAREDDGVCTRAWRRARARARALVAAPAFERALSVLIALSALELALQGAPPGPGELIARGAGARARSLAFSRVEALVTLLFAAECALRHLAVGARAYWACAWCRMDGAVVVLTLGSLVASEGGGVCNVLRLARLLRPLRLVRRNSGVRVVVRALLRTLPQVLSVCAVCALFVLVFAILGVQLLGGKFASCTDASVRTRGACTGHFWEEGATAASSREWRNPSIGSFDSVPAAALLLFELSSLEGWPTAMFRGIDAVGAGRAPELDHAPARAIFFVGWTLVGGLFMRNLFIGVIVDTFDATKRADDGLLFVTPEQRHWVRVQELMLRARALVRVSRPRGDPFGARLFDVLSSERFERGMLLVVGASTVCMAFEALETPPAVAAALRGADVAFVTILALEAAAKLRCYTARKYFADAWHRVDFAVLCGSALELVLSAADARGELPLPPALLRALRALRSARVLRAAHSARGLRRLLSTVLCSLPSLANVLLLLLLVEFVSAVLAMHLFGRMTSGDALGEHANFASLPAALLVLFACATGEEWTTVMHDAMHADGCVPGRFGGVLAWDGCVPAAAIPFFVLYTLLSTFVVLNILIAIILDQYGALGLGAHGARGGEVAAQLTAEHIDGFRDAWAALDPDATLRLRAADLSELLDNTPYPLGLKGHRSVRPRADRVRFVRALELSAYSGDAEQGSGALDRSSDADARGSADATGGGCGDTSGGGWVTYHDAIDAMITIAFGTRVLAADVESRSALALKTRQKRRWQQLANLRAVVGVLRTGGAPEPARTHALCTLLEAKLVPCVGRSQRAQGASGDGMGAVTGGEDEALLSQLRVEPVARVFAVVQVQRRFRENVAAARAKRIRDCTSAEPAAATGARAQTAVPCACAVPAPHSDGAAPLTPPGCRPSPCPPNLPTAMPARASACSAAADETTRAVRAGADGGGDVGDGVWQGLRYAPQGGAEWRFALEANPRRASDADSAAGSESDE